MDSVGNEDSTAAEKHATAILGDHVAPVNFDWAGTGSLTVNVDGSFTIAWSTAGVVDAFGSTPIGYRVFARKGATPTVFTTTSCIAEVSGSNTIITQYYNEATLAKADIENGDVIYAVVKSVDSVGNQDATVAEKHDTAVS